MRVIGTAGHVDHGKSTMVEALSGTHPDRLKEEQDREMTIVLGFSWFELPSGEEIGVVDVPGHRDFIENMLSGIGAIEAVLLVVAADEGVMPQTREHLLILDLLQIKVGIVVITKTDLIDDPDWLDLVESDVRESLFGTALENAPFVRFSAKTGEGKERLIAELDALLKADNPRPDLGRPRLSIDRAFSMSGFGTIVTGTLLDGHFNVGQDIEVLPNKVSGRIRGLQSHKKKEDIAFPGTRTAMNLSGISVEEISRGDVVCKPKDYFPTRRIDVFIRLVNNLSQPLKHDTEIKFFLGAAEVVGRVRLLGVDELSSLEEGFIQIELRRPIVGLRNDRFIIRRPSPGETIGGGKLLDVHPQGRHKRYSKDVIRRLKALKSGSSEDVLLEILLKSGTFTIADLIEESGLPSGLAYDSITKLIDDGIFVKLSETSEIDSRNWTIINITSKQYWESITKEIISQVEMFHQGHPLKVGISREEIRSRLGIKNSVFIEIIGKLIQLNKMKEAGALLSIPNHQIRFTDEQQSNIDELYRIFEKHPYKPPPVKECKIHVGDDLYHALITEEQLTQISVDVVFKKDMFEELIEKIREIFSKHQYLTVAELRDHLGTSRKYALAIMEYLDKVGLTIRKGDVRSLRDQN